MEHPHRGRSPAPKRRGVAEYSRLAIGDRTRNTADREVDDAGSSDEVRADSWADIRTVGAERRMRVDVGRVLDPRANADRNSPLFETWSSLRRTVGLNLGPGRGDRSFDAGMLRNDLEQYALALRNRFGITEIVDLRYVDALQEMRDASRADSNPIRIPSRWGGTQAPRTAARWHRRLLSRMIEFRSNRASSNAGLPPILRNVFGNRAKDETGNGDSVRVGPGWIETASGRRRPRDEFLTSILGHVDPDPRIEVRLISIERTVRLRFDSISDQRFQRFWTRWTAG